MKRLLSILSIVFLAVVLIACGKEDKKVVGDYADVADGYYFAIEEEYNHDWKYYTVVEVRDGAVVDVEWNALNIYGGNDKVTASRTGEYVMSGSQAAWYEQAKSAEQFIIAEQTDEVTYDDGAETTDAITGVSIKVKPLFDLINDAIDAGPVEKGIYVEGYQHHAIQPDSKGFQYHGEFLVVNGTIVYAYFDAMAEVDGELTSKNQLGIDYGMNWFEQSAKAADYVIDNQDFDVIYKENGHSDSIAGVSIHINEFEEIFNGSMEILPLFAQYSDGTYFAAADEFSHGTKYIVALTIEGGKLVDAKWDAVGIYGEDLKSVQSENGLYEMHDTDDLTEEEHAEKLEWHEQAAAVIEHAIDNQSLSLNYTNDVGNTDTITSVSMKVMDFENLVIKALENGPISKSETEVYADGFYYGYFGENMLDTIKNDAPTQAWRYTASVYVYNGTIVYVDLNAIHEINTVSDTMETYDFAERYAAAEGDPATTIDDIVGKLISKDELGYVYGMGLDFATGQPNGELTWSDNTDIVEAAIIEAQEFTVDYYDNDGHTDSIAGISIHVVEFEEAFNAAMGITEEIVLPPAE